MSGVAEQLLLPGAATRCPPTIGKLDALSSAQLRQFFELLDRWDREQSERGEAA